MFQKKKKLQELINWRRNYKNYILHIIVIDSARFMASSLSNLVNNFSEEIQIIKCKLGHSDKKCQTCGIKHKYYDCFLNIKTLKII